MGLTGRPGPMVSKEARREQSWHWFSSRYLHECLLLNALWLFPLVLLWHNAVNPILCPQGPPGSGGLKGEAGEMGPQVCMARSGGCGGFGEMQVWSSQPCFRGCCGGAAQSLQMQAETMKVWGHLFHL